MRKYLIESVLEPLTRSSVEHSLEMIVENDDLGQS